MNITEVIIMYVDVVYFFIFFFLVFVSTKIRSVAEDHPLNHVNNWRNGNKLHTK